MSYYKRHVFFCRNQREPPEACCNNHGALEIQAYSSSTPMQSGTPTSTSMTSKKSSIRTSYTAESSRGLGFD